jgi:hypothetical protein
MDKSRSSSDRGGESLLVAFFISKWAATGLCHLIFIQLTYLHQKPNGIYLGARVLLFLRPKDELVSCRKYSSILLIDVYVIRIQKRKLREWRINSLHLLQVT